MLFQLKHKAATVIGKKILNELDIFRPRMQDGRFGSTPDLCHFGSTPDSGTTESSQSAAPANWLNHL